MPNARMQPKQELKTPLDLSHHFSHVTKARKESSIKEFYKYFTIPGIGNLAGGEYTIHDPLFSPHFSISLLLRFSRFLKARPTIFEPGVPDATSQL